MGKGKENLVPLNERTPEEQRAIAKKGGQKSGEARRKKKATKDLVKMVLSMDVVTNRKTRNALKKLGYDVDAEGAPSVELLMQISIANQAMAGDLASARFLYDYAQIPDIKTVLERERIKAVKDGRAKVDVNLNTAEEAGIMEEITRRMEATGTSSVTAKAATPSPEGKAFGTP